MYYKFFSILLLYSNMQFNLPISTSTKFTVVLLFSSLSILLILLIYVLAIYINHVHHIHHIHITRWHIVWVGLDQKYEWQIKIEGLILVLVYFVPSWIRYRDQKKCLAFATTLFYHRYFIIVILSSLVWICQKFMHAVLITNILLSTKRTNWISTDLEGALLVHFSCTGVTQVI